MNDASAEYIRFDMQKIMLLKESYEECQKQLLEELPEINYNSRKQIVELLQKKLGVEIEDSKIQTIENITQEFDYGTEERYFIELLVVYLKNKFTLKNYINCIIRHEFNGVVHLRWDHGGLYMPNHQALSYNTEITDAILEQSSKVKFYIHTRM